MDKAYEFLIACKFLEAANLYEEAISLEPQIKSNYWHLGLCWLLQRDLERAKLVWEITEKDKVNTEYTNEITKFLLDIASEFGVNQRKYDVAIYILEAGLKIDPQNIEFFRTLANYCGRCLRFTESVEFAKKYFELAQDLPNQIFAKSISLNSLLMGGTQWEDIFTLADEETQLIQKFIDNPKQIGLNSIEIHRLFLCSFFLPYLSDTPQKNRYIQNQLSKICQDNIKVEGINFSFENRKSFVDRPLKIGYISHALRKNSVGWLSRWIFKHHNPSKFQVYTYFICQNPNLTDSVQDAIAKNSYKFYKLGSDGIGIATQIYQDEIDILVDLDSITLDISCLVMACKPAPIQVTWLGLDASGIPAIDYFIADPYVLPEKAQDYYSEKIWRLPNSYLAVDGFEVLFPTLHRDQINIPEDAIVYMSAQTGFKRYPDTIRLQMRILKSVPNSFLLIKGISDQKTIQSFFEGIAIEERISIDRLRFLPMVGGEGEHRANLDIADIILDTYPYNGATTTMEALWMCIPLVTKVGEQFAARNSYTMMTNAGITEGIAWSDDEYVDWGIRLGTDESLRKQVFWKLKESRKTSPLWNAEQFTREMESAYEQMWQIYIQSVQP